MPLNESQIQTLTDPNADPARVDSIIRGTWDEDGLRQAYKVVDQQAHDATKRRAAISARLDTIRGG